MKVRQLFLAAMLGLTGIGSSASAAPITFTTVLGNFESPPTGSLGTGFATVTMDVVAHTMTISASFSGLTGTTTAAHIHCCVNPPGNVGVATQTPTFAGFPFGVQAGSYLNTYDMTLATSFSAGYIVANGGTPASAEAALFAGMQAGQAYFNIHTSTSPGGEIRGFLAVPEPDAAWLAAASLLPLWFASRRSSAKRRI